MGYDANFWIALATGAIIVLLLQSERFALPCYRVNPKEPFTTFSPAQLTTQDRFRRAKFLYVSAILGLYLLFSFLGPEPLKQFNVKIVEPSSVPLYVCAAFIGLVQFEIIARLEGNLRGRLHRRAAVLVAFPQLANLIYAVMTQNKQTFKQRLGVIVDLCEKAEALSQNRTLPTGFDPNKYGFDILDERLEEITKLKKRAEFLLKQPANEVEAIAEEVGFDPVIELRRVISLLLVPFCDKAGFRQGYNTFLAWAGLPSEDILPDFGRMWDRALLSVPVALFILLVFALLATEGIRVLGLSLPQGWPASFLDGVMLIVFAAVTALATMFFGFLLLPLIIDADDFDEVGRRHSALLTPRNYAVIFGATYSFALVTLSLLNWFDINRPWTRVENPDLISTFLAVPQRVLVSALVPAIFATTCIRIYVRMLASQTLPDHTGSWISVVPAALALALLYSVETHVTSQIFQNQVPAWSLLYIFIVGFILGASIMYVLTNDVRESRQMDTAGLR